MVFAVHEYFVGRNMGCGRTGTALANGLRLDFSGFTLGNRSEIDELFLLIKCKREELPMHLIETVTNDLQAFLDQILKLEIHRQQQPLPVVADVDLVRI